MVIVADVVVVGNVAVADDCSGVEAVEKMMTRRRGMVVIPQFVDFEAMFHDHAVAAVAVVARFVMIAAETMVAIENDVALDLVVVGGVWCSSLAKKTKKIQ